MKKPRGIKIISVLGFLMSFLYVVIALVIFSKPTILKNLPGFPAESATGFAIFIGVFFLVFSVVYFIISRGLRKGKRFAKYLWVGLSGLFVFGGIISIIEGSYISVINLLFNLSILLYLLINKKAKAFIKK